MSLKGSLQTVALPEVLDFLSGTAKTGELRVDGAGTEGLLWFEEGAISGVRVRRGPNPVEAVFQLLRIEEGDFSFSAGDSRPDDVAAVERSEGHVGGVLEQAQARLRQWSEIVSVVPSLDHRVTLAATTPGDTVALDRSQWELVVAIGEGRSVGEVISARDLGEFEGCRALKHLVEASLAQIGEPAEAVEPAGARSAVEDEPPVVVPVEEEPPVVAMGEDEPVTAPVEEEPPVVAVGEDEPVAAPDQPVAAEGTDPVLDEAPVPVPPAVEEPVEEPAAAVEEPVEEPAAAVEEPAVAYGFEVFSGFGADGFDTSDRAGEEFEVRADAESGETGSEEVVDRYASLRSVIAEVGQTFDDDPYLAAGGADEPAMPAFGSPLPYGGVEAAADHDPLGHHPEEPTNGHAALQALLAEVSNEEFAGEGEEAIDGLADRGPWTRNELASFDGWRDDEGHGGAVPGPVGHVPLPGGYGQVPAHDFAGDVPAGAVGGGAAPGAEAEIDEDPAPVEEPINRGLLLKFLSSVRN